MWGYDAKCGQVTLEGRAIVAAWWGLGSGRAVKGRFRSDENEEHNRECLRNIDDHNLVPEALGVL
jgi:hypothetical protein